MKIFYYLIFSMPSRSQKVRTKKKLRKQARDDVNSVSYTFSHYLSILEGQGLEFSFVIQNREFHCFIPRVEGDGKLRSVLEICHMHKMPRGFGWFSCPPRYNKTKLFRQAYGKYVSVRTNPFKIYFFFARLLSNKSLEIITGCLLSSLLADQVDRPFANGLNPVLW